MKRAFKFRHLGSTQPVMAPPALFPRIRMSNRKVIVSLQNLRENYKLGNAFSPGNEVADAVENVNREIFEGVTLGIVEESG